MKAGGGGERRPARAFGDAAPGAPPRLARRMLVEARELGAHVRHRPVRRPARRDPLGVRRRGKWIARTLREEGGRTTAVGGPRQRSSRARSAIRPSVAASTAAASRSARRSDASSAASTAARSPPRARGRAEGRAARRRWSRPCGGRRGGVGRRQARRGASTAGRWREGCSRVHTASMTGVLRSGGSSDLGKTTSCDWCGVGERRRSSRSIGRMLRGVAAGRGARGKNSAVKSK